MPAHQRRLGQVYHGGGLGRRNGLGLFQRSDGDLLKLGQHQQRGPGGGPQRHIAGGQHVPWRQLNLVGQSSGRLRSQGREQRQQMSNVLVQAVGVAIERLQQDRKR